MNSYIPDNLDLAETARAMADSTPTGTLQHAAAGSVAITCATTRDLDHARTVLDGIRPENVRVAAIELLDRLAVEEPAHADDPERA